MDDLPELPFEQVLSYLNLEDRLRLSAVSRSCHQKIANSRVKSLCFSERPIGRILGKNRWISGAFAQNFISSTRFASFFDTFGQTILSSLKHLRLCDLNLRASNETALTRNLNSFSQLETLDMIRVQCCPQRKFELTLPMLTSIHLEELAADRRLTLDAPRLREVRAVRADFSDLRLEIVHGESVERLLADSLEYTEVKNLKNLQYLYVDYVPGADRTFLSSLQQLKEFHTNDSLNVSELFEQKQQLGRADLKVYLWGLLLNGPEDPAINALQNSFPDDLTRESFVCLAENRSRLADQIPFYDFLRYSAIEGVPLGLEVNVLKKFIDLKSVEVDHPVQNIQRFLDLLKNCARIVELTFNGDQPQDLFDRLPEHCAVQKLSIYRPPSDLAFLFRMKHLIDLDLNTTSIDSETVRRAFDELPVLSSFRFWISELEITIQVDHPKQFRVLVDNKLKTVSDLNAAIEFIFGIKRSRKRTADELE